MSDIPVLEQIPTEELDESISRLEAIFDEYGPVEFDEYDDEAVKAVCGHHSRLAKPIQKLLIELHQIELVRRSFGVDHAKVGEEILPLLELLREACVDEYKDL